MGNRPVLTRTRQPAGAAGAHLCAPPAPTQQHTGVWDANTAAATPMAASPRLLYNTKS